MIESLGGRLRVVFRSSPAPADREPDVPRTAARSRQVEFVAYGEDCVLSGFTRMDAARLTDMLNEHEEYQLVDVRTDRLDRARRRR